MTVHGKGPEAGGEGFASCFPDMAVSQVRALKFWLRSFTEYVTEAFNIV